MKTETVLKLLTELLADQMNMEITNECVQKDIC